MAPLRHFSIGLFAFAALTLTNQAAIIYSNGGNTSGGGNNPFSYNNVFVAEDFIVGSASSVNAVVFNAYTTSSTLPVTGIQVKIYGDSSGSVGSQLFSGTFGLDSATLTGTSGGFSLYDFKVLLPSWNLAAGNYWLGLQVDPAQWDMHWSIPTVGPFGNYGGMIGDNAGTPGSYTPYSWEHVFRLEGGAPVATPDPGATLSLLSVGIAGIFGLKRRFP